MNSPVFTSDSTSGGDKNPPQTIVIQQPPPGVLRKWFTRLILIALLISVFYNINQYSRYREYFAGSEPPNQRFHSGDMRSDDKIRLLAMTGPVMPPFPGRPIHRHPFRLE